MKKDYLYIPFLLVGVAAGYLIATVGGLTGWNLFREMFFGACVGLIFEIAFSKNEYGIWVGALIGLVIFVLLDFLAGSPITVKDKLADVCICSFIGWRFPVYIRQMIVGGVIGGFIGFGWGMIHRHQIGQVSFAPGFSGTILLAVIWFILGMGIAKLYMMAFGKS